MFYNNEVVLWFFMKNKAPVYKKFLVRRFVKVHSGVYYIINLAIMKIQDTYETKHTALKSGPDIEVIQ